MLNQAYLEINLTALKDNYLFFNSLNPKTFAVIKTNAYGLGVAKISKFMDSFVYGFAVASVSEAIDLRAQNITKPILVLSGFFAETEFNLAKKYNLILTITTIEQLDFIIKNKQKLGKVFLKFDSGMSRLGLNQNQIKEKYNSLKTLGDEIILTSHFACSDDVNNPHNTLQINNFNQIKQELNINKTSFNNTFGLINNLYNDDYSRVGIGIYGGIKHKNIQTVAGFFAPIIAIKNLNTGDKIGYSATWVCKQKTKIGIVAIGYGDGIPRNLMGKFVMINSKKSQVLGLVSMDMMVIDLTNIDAKLGDSVEIFGNNIKVYNFAQDLGTISYEVFTHLNYNLQRKYI